MGARGFLGFLAKWRRGLIHVRARNRTELGFISALNHFVVAAEEPPDLAHLECWLGGKRLLTIGELGCVATTAVLGCETQGRWARFSM